MIKIGVVADDITGANDIGLCFFNGGAKCCIYSYSEDLIIDDDVDVAIIDTDSRFDSKEDCFKKVKNASLVLKNWGADRFFNKTCSVFRGNIGTQFDAMREALNIKNSFIVLGFPKNGRTTINSIHYVNGTLLKDSQFSKDPIHPMKESNLIKILESQTKESVGAISYNSYDNAQKLTDEIKKMKEKYSYIIFDVRDDDDLMLLSSCLKDEINYCGSSALGEFLPKSLGINSKEEIKVEGIDENKGVLIVAGSLTEQTINQIKYMDEKYKTLKIDTLRLIKNEDISSYKNHLINDLVCNIKNGKNVIIHTANSTKEILETKELGYDKGLNDKEVGLFLSSFLSSIVLKVLNDSKTNRFISCGGDTSAKIAKSLGINKMFIVKEIVPGVPTLYFKGQNKNYFFVLKSGSFGKDDFLEKSVQSLTIY